MHTLAIRYLHFTTSVDATGILLIVGSWLDANGHSSSTMNEDIQILAITITMDKIF